jgi:hypothetical protein
MARSTQDLLQRLHCDGGGGLDSYEIAGAQARVVTATRDATKPTFVRNLRHLGEGLGRGLRGGLRRFFAHGCWREGFSPVADEPNIQGADADA